MKVAIVKQMLDTFGRGQVFAGKKHRRKLCFGFGPAGHCTGR